MTASNHAVIEVLREAPRFREVDQSWNARASVNSKDVTDVTDVIVLLVAMAVAVNAFCW